MEHIFRNICMEPCFFNWELVSMIKYYAFQWNCTLVFVVVHCPPVRLVWPNYEVVVFQPQSVTAPDLVYVTYFYVVKYPTLSRPPLLSSKFPPRDILSLALSADTAHFTSAQYHLPTYVSPVPVPEYRSCDNSTLGYPLPLLSRLPYSHCLHSLASTKIYSSGTRSCVYAAICCNYWGPLHSPPS